MIAYRESVEVYADGRLILHQVRHRETEGRLGVFVERAEASEGPNGDGTLWGGATGIDLFAWVCRHEAQHLTDLNLWWPNGWIQADDSPDQDWLPTAFEDASNGLYMPNNPTTNTDVWGYNPGRGPLADIEHYCLSNQEGWANGSANGEDWAAPGKQWQQP